MNIKDPIEVLNDNMEFLVDYLKRELRCLGKVNGLFDSQISDMERDFIARLAFAAIIGDDKKNDECEDCPAKDCCSYKEHIKKPEKKPEKFDGLPDDVINSLLYVKRLCKAHECEDCPFSTEDVLCRLCENPEDWEV